MFSINFGDKQTNKYWGSYFMAIFFSHADLFYLLGHFIIVCSVPWPLNKSEVGVSLPRSYFCLVRALCDKTETAA